ncbi:MAG TPA: CoA transferase [Azospirillaceae bacterium]|nr:CoA transferase [Azospirillaceae bacterium]
MAIQDELVTLLGIGGLDRSLVDAVEIEGRDPVVYSPFRLGEASALALGAQAAAVVKIWEMRTGRRQKASIDTLTAAMGLKCVSMLQHNGRSVPLPDPAYPTVDLYQTGDGRWIMLHGGYPRLRDGLLTLLGCANDAGAVAQAVSHWSAQELEDTIADQGLCGAFARTRQEWLAHPQGRHLADTPVVIIEKIGEAPPQDFAGRPIRPLSGVRVIDCTHVLAGPTCARTLAEQGADVLHISGSQLPYIPSFVMDTGHGKRAAYIDLVPPGGGGSGDNERLARLVAEADVFSESFRPGALRKLGFGPQECAKIRPGIVYVSASCYGEDGPWGGRPGWEQLAQTVSGMAFTQGKVCPDPRPGRSVALSSVYPNDYVSGYLAAFGTLAALVRRATEGGSWHVRVVLTRSAMWLQEMGQVATPPDQLPKLPAPTYPPFPPDMLNPRLAGMETPYGPMTFLAPGTRFSETPARWERPTVPQGFGAPVWLPR